MSNPSNPPPRDRDGIRRKAQNHFEVAEARTNLVKQIVASENAAFDARTAKLRALRLAKEEAEAQVVALPEKRKPRLRKR